MQRNFYFIVLFFVFIFLPFIPSFPLISFIFFRHLTTGVSGGQVFRYPHEARANRHARPGLPEPRAVSPSAGRHVGTPGLEKHWWGEHQRPVRSEATRRDAAAMTPSVGSFYRSPDRAARAETAPPPASRPVRRPQNTEKPRIFSRAGDSLQKRVLLRCVRPRKSCRLARSQRPLAPGLTLTPPTPAPEPQARALGHASTSLGRGMANKALSTSHVRIEPWTQRQKSLRFL